MLWGVALLAGVLVAHSALLQSREVAWVRASVAGTLPSGSIPGTPLLDDPQAWDLQARWLTLYAASAVEPGQQVGLLRQAATAVEAQLRIRPQWAMGWLNWARIDAQLYPGGIDWQRALVRAVSLGDRGWAFQSALAQVLLSHESFMVPETRSAVERSLLGNLFENQELVQELTQQGLFSALCADPVSSEARQVCEAGTLPH